MAEFDLNPDGPHSPERTAEAGQLFDDVSRLLVYATMPGKGGLKYPADAYRLVGDLYSATGRFPQMCSQVEDFLGAQAASGHLYEARGRDIALQVDVAAVHLSQARAAAHNLTRALQAVQADINGLGTKGAAMADQAGDAAITAAYALSKDRLTLVIKRRTPAGILTSTFSREAQAGPFTDADVKYVLGGLPAASRTMEPGQRNRTRRFVTRSGTLYTHVMTGPPTWWLPRVRREKGGTLMAGWLRFAAAVKFDLTERAPGVPERQQRVIRMERRNG